MAAQGGGAGKPVFARAALNDYIGAMLATLAVLAALDVRDRTGRGQFVDTTLLHAGAFANADAFQRYAGKPPRYVNDAQHLGPNALQRLYRAGDGWVFLSVRSDREWRALCRALGRPEWEEDPRFRTGSDRARHDDALSAALQEELSARRADPIVTTLVSAGAPAATVPEGYGDGFFADAQALANDLIISVDHPAWPNLKLAKLTPRLSNAPKPTALRERAAPQLGQHTREILAELGYTDAQIDDLLARGIVAGGPRS
jgi:crotonobetainyl-CoA:carnitine CoA-transferase CaiB-like acyl-CoA transferase